MQPFLGKFRGKVESNVDPQNLGRIQISVPLVLGGGQFSWAMPCVPYAGPTVGLFALPPVGANIWVEFEGGDPDYPIWSGCFWGTGEVPAQPAIAEIKMLKTENISIQLDDTPGAAGVSITTTTPPLSFTMNSEGITLQNGSAVIVLDSGKIQVSYGAQTIQLTPQNVNINQGALEVI
ncbi:MAG: phage baseplate assembly protein V [Pseudomonadales bacterium]